MSSTLTAAPSPYNYLQAANWAYAQAGTNYPGPDTTLPSGFSYFMVNGQKLIDYDPATGLYAAALKAPTGQIMIAFEGTNLATGNAEFTLAQVSDDHSIIRGANALSYAPALSFTDQVLSDALAQGYTRQDVVLAGHSLGGAEVEYVASQTGLSGTTFGAPGIPSGDGSASNPAQVTDFVEQGDPVGNYAQGGNLASLLQHPNIVHYGTTKFLGAYFSYGTALLAAASISYQSAISATTITGQLTGLSATLAALTLAVPYHYLETYSNDLPGAHILGADLSAGAISANLISDLTTIANALGAGTGLTLGSSSLGAAGSGAAGLGAAGSTPVSVTIPNLDLAPSGAASVSGGQAVLTETNGQSVEIPLPSGGGRTFSLTSDGHGNTVFRAGAGQDGYVFGGANGVQTSGGAAPLDVIGGSGAVFVAGGSGNLTVSGATNRGATTFAFGGSGSNLLYGGAGATTIAAGTGASTMIGGAGTTIMLTNGSAPDYVVAGSGPTTIIGGIGTGDEQIFAGSGADFIALGSGADMVFAGSGASSISGGTGRDIYGFINGHAGGSELIAGLKANDSLVFGGYGGNPITSEGVLHGSDLLTLSDGTVILLLGIDHKVFT